MSTTETIDASHTDEELDSYISAKDSLLAIEKEQEELSREWYKIQSNMDPQPMTLEAVKKVALADQRLLEIRQESIKLDVRESELTKAMNASEVHVYAQDLIQRGQEIRQCSEGWPITRMFLAIGIIAVMWVYLEDMFAFSPIWVTLPLLLIGTMKIATERRKYRKLSSTISSRDIVFLARLGIQLHKYVPEHSVGR